MNQSTVLANKYRPRDFKDLVGQEVMVRTLSNAINGGRLPNAFLLSGIRGIGKTTTARVIARALNCSGKDEQGEMTVTPCGVCKNCEALNNSRHTDVIEIDAASNTGVDNIREIIESCKYKPSLARFKIYIIDEVHMLSKSAFNALLKTLEEPPKHVKFIFATTEIRKIPITILSRCQRFDLKRLDDEALTNHLQNIAGKEDMKADIDALKIIANVSGGSVRDALSLLDQANSYCESTITKEQISNMLGLSDGGKIVEIFQLIAQGNIEGSLQVFQNLYDNGADSILVLNDLLNFTHFILKVKIANSADVGFFPGVDEDTIKKFSTELSIAYLTKCWQMLLKGLSETKEAENPYRAAEMILIRLAYSSSLPLPQGVSKDKQNIKQETPTIVEVKESLNDDKTEVIKSETIQESVIIEKPLDDINNFQDIAKLCQKHSEMMIYSYLASDIRLVNFEQGRVEIIVISDAVPKDFTVRLSELLFKWSGKKWSVVISEKEEGAQTIKEESQSENDKIKEELREHNDVKKVMEVFPDAYIKNVAEQNS